MPSPARFQRTERLNDSPLRVDSNGRLQHLAWKVKVVSGPDAGLSLALTGKTIVGSGETSRLKLTDTSVSREHLELEARSDGVSLRDLGSTNGTLVGGARIDTAIVEQQAVISLGRTLLSLSVDVQEEDIEGPLELEGLVAVSAPMRRVFGLVERLAPTDTPVVLFGETGTGKEGLARALHARSLRRKGPMVVVDCGALAPQLIESELFGHTRGAFTGAVNDRPGAFAEAEGGTLFLDEIGDLPLELQPRLLRALEARQIKRLGEDRHRAVDVRIVAATNRQLDVEVKEGRFRSDLYFRLAVAMLRVPPLRERREDLPTLIRALLTQLGRESFDLNYELLTQLASYSWPGNVRELRNVVARAVVSDEVSLETVLNPVTGEASAVATRPAENPSAQLAVPFKEAKEKLVEAFTRQYLVALLAKYDGNVTQMARASGLARTYLHDLLSRYGLARAERGETP
jgi:two-component system, NtrC family, response regulator GlrR